MSKIIAISLYFQVVARNSKADSNSSEVVKMELNDVTTTNKVDDLKVASQTDSSVTLQWKALGSAENVTVEYEVFVQAPQYYPEIPTIMTTNTSLTGMQFAGYSVLGRH